MSVILGIVLGGILCSILFKILTADEVAFYNSNYELVRECEKALPRNEYCKLIAVPKANNEVVSDDG